MAAIEAKLASIHPALGRLVRAKVYRNMKGMKFSRYTSRAQCTRGLSFWARKRPTQNVFTVRYGIFGRREGNICTEM